MAGEELAADEASPSERRAALARPELLNVGLVVWQSSVVLADLLLRRPPYGQGSWPDVDVLDLGCGPGVVGLALVAAGARVVLSDLGHVTPLTIANVDANCVAHANPLRGPPEVVEHLWGSDVSTLTAALKRGRSRCGLPLSGLAGGLADCGDRCTRDEGAAAAAAVAAAAVRDRPGFDLITAADCLYEPPFFGDLLRTLGAVAAPHACVWLAQRVRGLGEGSFPAAAAEAGWAVEVVPPYMLHEEFRDGTYQVLRMARLG